jgi:hypothetical protein
MPLNWMECPKCGLTKGGFRDVSYIGVLNGSYIYFMMCFNFECDFIWWEWGCEVNEV